MVENRGDWRIVGNTLASNFGVGGGVVRNLTGATITRELSPGAAAILVPPAQRWEIMVHTGTLETIDGESAGAIAVAKVRDVRPQHGLADRARGRRAA